MGVRGTPEAEANARLIAAAPHMADAIRDMLFAIDRGYLGEIGPSAFIDDLRAALAAARPETVKGENQ